MFHAGIEHFTLGIVAQFLYVAAQTGIFSFCVNYIIENDADVTPAKAARKPSAAHSGK